MSVLAELGIAGLVPLVLNAPALADQAQQGFWGGQHAGVEPIVCALCIFWTAFLRRLRERGLSRVQLVISDAHAGLKKAIASCCQGCSWQRCRVHFARNLLAKVPKGSQDMVAAALRSVFVQQDEPAVEQQWD